MPIADRHAAVETTARTSVAPPMPDSSTVNFVAAMGAVATGVTVVATDGPGGRAAQTVSAMCSVSADPALVLVCLHGRSPVNDAISENGVFCVNVLATQHDHVADTFAGRPWPGKQRWDFTCGHWTVRRIRLTPRPRRDRVVRLHRPRRHRGRHPPRLHRARRRRGGTPRRTARVQPPTPTASPQPFEPSTFPDYPDAHPAPRTRSTK